MRARSVGSSGLRSGVRGREPCERMADNIFLGWLPDFDYHRRSSSRLDHLTVVQRRSAVRNNLFPQFRRRVSCTLSRRILTREVCRKLMSAVSSTNAYALQYWVRNPSRCCKCMPVYSRCTPRSASRPGAKQNLGLEICAVPGSRSCLGRDR